MSLIEYIEKIRPFAAREMLALFVDDIHRLGFLEAERFAAAHKVRLLLTS